MPVAQLPRNNTTLHVFNNILKVKRNTLTWHYYNQTSIYILIFIHILQQNLVITCKL